ncbi:probable rRNA-processing protein EBP2 homolog [Homarus americanus]|uniref:rRNA-processing protein EBP2-like n=1 Tax=Homarus americanus TaxID=6706 RepID=A0A8J5N130_HOMAM|nr:probable rRNA-processing protein EBP2 homolog [Homarus americanus]XP_042218846.1 probable rRNA-processing protein EBP2 homolog [Homarus americanus]XP_042218848.1 probable rRNA-processing protein EBP2 homolog [Homarus americanus]XP_042218849.1 probable rRNA-processing protein EBP2 homolog [Homarus americanus]XP_042218850.1 probable rRNA-processing protein EBP2 homolog [Homarus americanus]XP_042218851.1 probable rRNA-processing protein EBP2 homolog [Homarus americanus]KAG7170797.1 rRNA-proce
MSPESEAESSEYEYSDIDEREAMEDDSDAELQEAFARGELKPGLHVVEEKVVKEYKNDVNGLKQKIEEFQLTVPWVERFDVTNELAAMAPELDAEITEHAQTREKRMKSQFKNFTLENDPIHNDFKREMTFYRQAQAAVMEGFERLQSLNQPTLRPSDYFAQMAKSDEHMQKVRRRLMNKQIGQQISQRVKKIREIKKYGKKVQIEAEQQKHKNKKEMLEKIKKFRKGKADTIDFLEDKGPLRGGGAKTKTQLKKGTKRVTGKRVMKDKKYGFGGKKRNIKRNTAKSHANDSNMPAMKRPGASNKKRGQKPKGNRNKKSKSKSKF